MYFLPKGIYDNIDFNHRLYTGLVCARFQRMLVLGLGKVFPAVRRVQDC